MVRGAVCGFSAYLPVEIGACAVEYAVGAVRVRVTRLMLTLYESGPVAQVDRAAVS